MNLRLAIVCAGITCVCLNSVSFGAVISIKSNATDNHITDSTTIPSGSYQDGGTAIGANTDAIRIGGGGASPVIENLVGVFAFPLPTIAAGEVFSDASYTFNLTAKEGTVTSFGVDVYALPGLRSSPTLLISDFYIGPYGNDPTDSTPLQDNFLTNSSVVGFNSSSATANASFVSFLNSLYNGNTDPAGGPGQYLFLRLNPDADPPNGANNRYRVSQFAGTTTDPTITLTTSAVPEPTTWSLLLGGTVLGYGFYRRWLSY